MTALDAGCHKNNFQVIKHGLDTLQTDLLKRRVEATRLLFLALENRCDYQILEYLFLCDVDPNAISEVSLALRNTGKLLDDIWIVNPLATVSCPPNALSALGLNTSFLAYFFAHLADFSLDSRWARCCSQ